MVALRGDTYSNFAVSWPHKNENSAEVRRAITTSYSLI